MRQQQRDAPDDGPDSNAAAHRVVLDPKNEYLRDPLKVRPLIDRATVGPALQ